jgi:transcriptional regulator with XRE-family HTH domain
MTKQGGDPGHVGLSVEGMHPSFEASPIGEYLRRQRLLRGVTAEELARLTRIPLRSIERLESGQFDGQSDGFARGFVRTVADALGLDVEDTVSRMLEEPISSAREGCDEAGLALRRRLSAVAAVFVLLWLMFFAGRALWERGGEPAAGGSEDQIVVWHDPVRALALSTGLQPESTAALESPGIDPTTGVADSSTPVP